VSLFLLSLKSDAFHFSLVEGRIEYESRDFSFLVACKSEIYYAAPNCKMIGGRGVEPVCEIFADLQDEIIAVQRQFVARVEFFAVVSSRVFGQPSSLAACGKESRAR
jgi:hypothetical protein